MRYPPFALVRVRRDKRVCVCAGARGHARAQPLCSDVTYSGFLPVYPLALRGLGPTPRWSPALLGVLRSGVTFGARGTSGRRELHRRAEVAILYETGEVFAAPGPAFLEAFALNPSLLS